MSTPRTASAARAPIVRVRDVLAWALPLWSCIGCGVFFVALSMRARWLVQPVLSESLSMATVVGVSLLLSTVGGIFVFSLVAERADRATRGEGGTR